MNKKSLLYVITACLVVIGAFSLSTMSTDGTYSPREKQVEGISGYENYLKSVRGNQITGAVANEDVANVLSEINSQKNLKFKADWPLNWEFKGPDNIGGRTRCLVIDKDNKNVMYTGGVSGSIFKTTNKGGSWYPITLNDDNFGVTSMAQTNDGTLFYGTGENGLLLGIVEGTRGSGFNGMGMYKSTDGETFTVIPSTNTHGNIWVLTSHPTENIIFSGSSNGLRMSNNGGTTWTLLRGGQCKDIKFNKNGVLLAYMGSSTNNSIYRSTTPTDKDSYVRISTIPNSSRSAIAWSESDPSYCYVVSVGRDTFDGRIYASGALRGLHKSTDGGVSFERIVGKMSQFFAPFTAIGNQAQGNYDIALAVHPRDKDRVFIGGMKFAEWTLAEGPKIVGNNFDAPNNPFGLHADKHFITFDNSGEDPIMYVCTDGGVAKTTNKTLDNYTAINNGYSTTQFFNIAAGINGQVVGGTQDNNTILLGESYPRKKGSEIIPGDGFQCAISQLNPNIIFGESQYGNLRRSVTGGSDMSSIWDNRSLAARGSASNPTVYFNNPLCLWENPDVIESVKLNGLQGGEDTLIDARLYFAMNNGIWMCKNALANEHNKNNPKDEGAIRWFRVSSLSLRIHHLKTSIDGNSLFATTERGKIYRIDSMLVAQFDTASLVDNNAIATKLVQTDITSNLNVSGRTITSLAIDQSNPNRVVVTAGNYGNTNFVYVTNDALSASPTWTSIQGNLPKFPVYTAIISSDDPDIIVLGTEFGIWATNNGTSANPTWAEALDGVDSDNPLPRVPVFDLVQVSSKAWTGPRIYAGTHGMGIWVSKSLLTGIPKIAKNTEKAVVRSYPNPTSDYIIISTDIKGAYSLTIYDLNGKAIISQAKNVGNTRIVTSTLPNGNYFVEIVGPNSKAVSKIIVQH